MQGSDSLVVYGLSCGSEEHEEKRYHERHAPEMAIKAAVVRRRGSRSLRIAQMFSFCVSQSARGGVNDDRSHIFGWFKHFSLSLSWFMSQSVDIWNTNLLPSRICRVYVLRSSVMIVSGFLMAQ